MTLLFRVIAEFFILHRRLLVCRVWQINGFFRTFHRGKKVRRWVCTWGRNWVRTLLHPHWRLSWRISSRMQLVCGCSFQVVGGNFWTRTQKSGGLGEGWDGASSCVSLQLLLENFVVFPCPLCSRSSHLESGTLFPLSLLLAVIFPGVWVLLMVAKIGFFGRCLFPLVQCFVQQWMHALRQYFGGFGRISHIFYVAADSNP